MRATKLLGALIAMGLLVSACSPASSVPSSTATTTPTAAPVVTPTQLPSETPAATETGAIGKAGPASAAVSAAVAKLAQSQGMDESQIKVVKDEAVEWPNGCLGVNRPGMMCTMMITPGYRVILEANGQQYEFHTNLSGETVIQAGQFMPQTADKVVVWEQPIDGRCSRVEIGEQGVAYGACGGKLSEVKLEPARAAELSYLLAIYQPFSGSTKAGSVSFNGQGRQEASAAEMRSVAEWASLVNMEAQGGRSSAAEGLAIGWHQEGGIAGVCNDLAIYLTGWAVPNSCKLAQAKSLNTYRLSADELEHLYRWVDQYTYFEFVQKDPAMADAMKVTLVFTGHGTQTPTAGAQQEVVQFASGVFRASAR